MYWWPERGRGVNVACFLLRRVGTWTRLQGFTEEASEVSCVESHDNKATIENYEQQKLTRRTTGKEGKFGEEKRERREKRENEHQEAN